MPPGREFGSWTPDLKRMAAWLKSCGVTTVAMQSTGVCWIAVYEVLEKFFASLAIQAPVPQPLKK